MIITLLQILFYGLIPLGIFTLVMAIRLLRKSFFGKILTELPFTRQEAEFKITDGGSYGVWQKGKMLKRTLIDQFELQLVDIATGQAISLHNSFFAPHVNGFDTGRMEWKRFSAPSGRYKLHLTERASETVSWNILSALMPNNKPDYSQYWLQIRESQPVFIMVVAIPMILLSVTLIFGGLVLAINVHVVATYLGITSTH